jgi:hypothetical protein
MIVIGYFAQYKVAIEIASAPLSMDHLSRSKFVLQYQGADHWDNSLRSYLQIGNS